MGGYSADWVIRNDDGPGWLGGGSVVVVPQMYGDVRKVSNFSSL